MRGSGHQTPQRSWLISFADLLTLLLCFFLSVISFSPLNPHQAEARSAVTSGADQQKGPDAERIRRFEQGGTQLAPNTHEGSRPHSGARGIRLIFLEDDFSPAGDELLAAAKSRIKSAVNGADLKDVTVKIHACSANQLEGKSDSFRKAARRTAVMRRQLIDSAGTLGKEAFLFRNLGGRCETLRGTAKQSSAAGLVEIEAQKQNG